MAHKKGGGSSRNGRDSQGQRLGIKNLVENMSSAATSLFVSTAPRCIPAGM